MTDGTFVMPMCQLLRAKVFFFFWYELAAHRSANDTLHQDRVHVSILDTETANSYKTGRQLCKSLCVAKLSPNSSNMLICTTNTIVNFINGKDRINQYINNTVKKVKKLHY